MGWWLVIVLATICHGMVPEHNDPNCTTSSPTGEFYDLRPLMSKDDYIVNGYDYGRNFSINVCKPVNFEHENLSRVKNPHANISGVYSSENGKSFSIGYVFFFIN